MDNRTFRQALNKLSQAMRRIADDPKRIPTYDPEWLDLLTKRTRLIEENPECTVGPTRVTTSQRPDATLDDIRDLLEAILAKL